MLLCIVGRIVSDDLNALAGTGHRKALLLCIRGLGKHGLILEFHEVGMGIRLA